MKKVMAVLFVLAMLSISGFAQSGHGTDLTWIAPTTGVTPTGYFVYRTTVALPVCSGLSGLTRLNSTPVATLAYSDNTVSMGSTYCYTVRSFDGTFESGDSVAVLASFQTPNPPTGVTGTRH